MRLGQLRPALPDGPRPAGQHRGIRERKPASRDRLSPAVGMVVESQPPEGLHVHDAQQAGISTSGRRMDSRFPVACRGMKSAAGEPTGLAARPRTGAPCARRMLALERQSSRCVPDQRSRKAVLVIPFPKGPGMRFGRFLESPRNGYKGRGE